MFYFSDIFLEREQETSLVMFRLRHSYNLSTARPRSIHIAKQGTRRWKSTMTDQHSSPFKELECTLVFCRRIKVDGRREILLGEKKKGFGCGKCIAFGGKVELNETIEHAAIRELEEECGLKAKSLINLGHLTMKMSALSTIYKVHVFETWEFEGEAVESDEMKPQWYTEDSIPYERMWADNLHWFPFVFQQKRFLAR